MAQPKKTTADVIIPLRARILRPGLPIEKSHYAHDHLETTFHLCVELEGEPVSCASFMFSPCSYFPEQLNSYQLRGMATDPKYRGQHLGQKIIFEAERILKNQKCELLWFNARTSAVLFYEKCGYQQIGEIFQIPDVGPHRVMFKRLT